METFGQESWLVHKSASITTGPQQPLYEWLLYYDPDNPFELKPGLAESWDHKDFKEWTFKIRQGVQWDKNQGEVTAEDVAYTLNLISREDAKSTDTPFWRPRVMSMKVVDKYTLTFSFDTIEPVVAYHLSNWRRTQMMSKNYIEGVGEDKADREPVGSGPYRLDKHVQGSEVELVARGTDHWRVPAKWEKMVFKNVPESTTRLAMLDTGRADVALLDFEQLEEAKAKGLALYPVEGTSQFCIMFGGMFAKSHPNYKGDAPWHDIRVREAMCIAIDREAINKTFFANLGTYEATPGNNVAPLDTVADMPMPYDPDRAKQLLTEAGKQGFPAKIISYVYPGLPQTPQVVEAIAGYWEAIGIKPEITPMDRIAFRSLWLEDKTNGMLWPWGNPVQPLYEARFEKFFYSEDIGFQIFTDDHLDSVYKELQTTVDRTKRAQMLADAQRYLRKNWAACHVCNVPQSIYGVVPSRVGEWKPRRAGQSTTWEYLGPK